MTHWHDLPVIYAENVALVKLCHVLGGLYIWEFVQSLGYEYSIITGRRKLTLTSPLYIATRWLTLVLITIEFAGFDARHPITCQAMITLNFTFGTLALLSSSALVILRAIALWEQNKVVIAIGCILWLTNASIYSYSIATFRGENGQGYCMFNRASHDDILVLSTFITDFSTLALMFAGVMRWRNIRGRGGIWWVLYTQGLAWIVIFTLVALPPVVFVFLRLNDVMDRMFLLPEVVAMTVCATRMYLGLVNSAAANPSPVGAVRDKGQHSGGQIQFKKSPVASYGGNLVEGTYNLNTGSVIDIAVPGTASASASV